MKIKVWMIVVLIAFVLAAPVQVQRTAQDPGGGHLHPRTMQAAVRQLTVAAGIKDIRRAVHSLRHTVGADLRKRGSDIRDIQDVLRHADIGTTQIYTQMAREELRKKLPRRFIDYRQRRLT